MIDPMVQSVVHALNVTADKIRLSKSTSIYVASTSLSAGSERASSRASVRERVLLKSRSLTLADLSKTAHFLTHIDIALTHNDHLPLDPMRQPDQNRAAKLAQPGLTGGEQKNSGS